MNGKELIAQLDDLHEKRQARCIDLKTLAERVHAIIQPFLEERLKPFGETARLLSSTCTKTKEGTLAIELFKLDFAEPRIESSATCGNFSVHAKIGLEEGKTALRLRFTDNTTGCAFVYSPYSLFDLDGKLTATSIAWQLRTYGYGTEEMVSALHEAIERLGKTVMDKIDKAGETLREQSANPLYKSIFQTLEKFAKTEKKNLETRVEHHLPACMEQVNRFVQNLDCIGETIAIVNKAQWTFGNLDDDTIQRHFVNGVLEYGRQDRESGVQLSFSTHWIINDPREDFNFTVSWGEFSTEPDARLEDAVNAFLSNPRVPDRAAGLSRAA